MGRSKKSSAGAKASKPLFKRWWFWLIVVIIVAGAFGSQGGTGSTVEDQDVDEATEETWNAREGLFGITVEAAWDEIEAQGYTLSGIKSPTGAELNSDEEVRHSSTAQRWQVFDAEQDDGDKTVVLSVTSPEDFAEKYASDASAEQSEAVEQESTDAGVPTEYLSALTQATGYASTMHMSKQAIFDQLVSEYGGQFSQEAAQYAIDNVQADWNANALAKAEDYSETMHMSRQGIYDQLVSEYGEQFTPEEAQYAIDNVQADWNANALEKAREYQEGMSMSPEAIRDQLTSEYGEQFTQEEADWAIANL